VTSDIVLAYMCFIRHLKLFRWRGSSLATGHGSMRVRGQFSDGSHGSRVTKNDPLSSLVCPYIAMTALGAYCDL